MAVEARTTGDVRFVLLVHDVEHAVVVAEHTRTVALALDGHANQTTPMAD
jgi:hypothetical protein